MARIHIAIGRKSGVRPADIVGAIANESGIAGKSIGSIEMGNGFSLVEIPEGDVDQVMQALTGAKIRGQRVTVKRDRDNFVPRKRKY
jgi:ATP-dependent RNA helicase DeaD